MNEPGTQSATPNLKMLLIFLMTTFAIAATAYVALKVTLDEPTDSQGEALGFCLTIANGTLSALLGAIGGARASA